MHNVKENVFFLGNDLLIHSLTLCVLQILLNSSTRKNTFFFCLQKDTAGFERVSIMRHPPFPPRVLWSGQAVLLLVGGTGFSFHSI